MKFAKCIVATVVASGIAATAGPSFAGTEFLSYEGRNSVHEGQGGNKKVVEGVEFWMSGDPPHRFQVLGSISDRRHETGLIGLVRMSSLDNDIAHTAKAAGGDAVIMTDQSEEYLGTAAYSNSNFSGSVNGNSFQGSGFGSSFARPIKNHLATYVVVRYLPDAAPLPAQPQPWPVPAPPQDAAH